MYAQRILDELGLPDLDLRAGHTVLDIGCGYGDTFASLREAVAPGGRVIGLDYSPGMVARARRRVRENGWDDVEVRRADFTRADLELESVDRAVAFASISAMPDVPAALSTAFGVLRPGGLLVVFDMKLRAAGWSTPLIWLFAGLYRLLAGWAGVDVLDTGPCSTASVSASGWTSSVGRRETADVGPGPSAREVSPCPSNRSRNGCARRPTQRSPNRST
jgi:SAM-dependent methyltransferase